ncbi:tetratricopeptide repeat protein [Hassallia byssoidea VB512170]|uniref:Tetratricopeptide repeat protein n=1 Tax=Hassallia byssoidea VB512170 TaxID=1304833 RepID=A0A846H4S9_9CYAN|nr:tetratricopeptide repeat protein [Hassalia byssoidea]NEU72372.1 tetratricopeptide repeat protein [Hassalia byssoidea VB512170]
MNRCYRFIMSFMMAIALNFVTFSAEATPIATDFLKLGADKMQRGNYQEAIQDLTEAIQLESNFAFSYSDRCLAYLQLQDYHSAIACTKAINFALHNAKAYLIRGLAHYRQGNYLAAIADNSQAIALKPHDFRAYYNRGIATAMLGNQLQAIADYNKALSIIPQNFQSLQADIYNDRGLARLELADLQAAMLDFDKAIRLNANDDRAYFNRACACTRSGDILGAVRDFSEVIRLNPSNAQAYVNRGVARHWLGYHEAAIADLEQAARRFGKREKVAYQKTLDILKSVQQQIPSGAEIALL